MIATQGDIMSSFRGREGVKHPLKYHLLRNGSHVKLEQLRLQLQNCQRAAGNADHGVLREASLKACALQVPLPTQPPTLQHTATLTASDFCQHITGTLPAHETGDSKAKQRC